MYSKFESMTTIDAVLVPFIGLANDTILKSQACLHLYQFIRDKKVELENILMIFKKQMNDTIKVFKQYQHLLQIDEHHHCELWYGERTEGRNQNETEHENDKAKKKGPKHFKVSISADQSQKEHLPTIVDEEETEEEEGYDTNDEDEDNEEHSQLEEENENKNFSTRHESDSVRQTQQHTPSVTSAINKGSLDDCIRSPVIRHTVQETKAEIQKLKLSLENIRTLTPQQIYLPLVQINCQPAQNVLIAKTEAIIDALLGGTRREMKRINDYILKYTQNQLQLIEKPCKDVEQLFELKKFLEKIESEIIPILKNNIRQVEVRYEEIILEFNTTLTLQEHDMIWQSKMSPLRLQQFIQQNEMRILEEEDKFKNELLQEQQEFGKALDQIALSIEEFHTYGPCDDETMEKRSRQVDHLVDTLGSLKGQSVAFNRKEKLFKLPITEYGNLEVLSLSFQSFIHLWRTVSMFATNHKLWMNESFLELIPTKMESFLIEWFNELTKLEKLFKKTNANGNVNNDKASDEQFAADPSTALLSPAVQVCIDCKQKIQEFQKHLPLIFNLRNPGLRLRHWSQLFTALGKNNMQPDKSLTYNILLQMGIRQHANEIVDICMVAEKVIFFFLI
ncbi:dynein heavy chain 2 [Reticulomyxa filosa]|uniref:Dynein heavy chain 2 n=1 Tax=Reticulomyxa filosa TaxID=46433 RepID=X6NZ38_RETFI|nr:dynein heavy chain 2 [Reticulomyxa filosa]|eukprot:ETO31148.1 dynein heavy chain 2 [Reticulomyxa filosa]